MYKAFEEVGINIVFAIPLTIDGINGGISLGIEQATRESVRQIENMAATSLETRDNEAFGVLCAEIQGRNRDDITAETLKHFDSAGKVAETFGKRLIVLECQNGGRNQDRNLLAIANCLEGCPYCHFRFSKAYITTNQAVHRSRRFHITFYISCSLILIRCVFVKE